MRACRLMHPRLRSALPWLPWLLVALPAIVLAQLLSDHAVNAPFLDDFMNVPLFQKQKAAQFLKAHSFSAPYLQPFLNRPLYEQVRNQAGLNWHDFFAAQMEHRIAFSRLVFLLFHQWWPTNYLRQMWFSWLLLCLTMVNLVLLLRLSMASLWRKAWPVAALAALSLFSPVQYQVVLWAFMHQVVCLLFFFTSAMIIWQMRWPVWLRFILALLCVLCATFSFSSAILFWLLLLPVIWWCAPQMSRPAKGITTVIWLAIFAVVMGGYFHGLKNEVEPEFSIGQGNKATMGRNFQEVLEDPWRSLGYAMRIQGGFIARGAQDDLLKISLNFGIGLMTLYALCALYALCRFRDAELRRRLMPWLLLGLYGIGTMFAIALGRVWLTRTGVTALSGRYTIHAMTLCMVLPVLVWMVGRDVMERHPRTRPVLRDVLLVVGVVFLTVQINSWHYGSRFMEMWESARLRAAANTLFYNTGCPIDYDYAGVPRLAQMANDLGILKPSMLKNRRLDNFRTHPRPLNESFACWDSLAIVHTKDGPKAEAVGCAIFKQYARVPDAILLTWFDPRDRHWEIFRVTHATAMPLYLEGMFSYDIEFAYPPAKGVRENLSEFNSQFSLEELPEGVHKVAAWAYDHNTRTVSLIPGYYEVDREKAVVTELGKNADVVGLREYASRKPRKQE